MFAAIFAETNLDFFFKMAAVRHLGFEGHIRGLLAYRRG